MNEITYTPGRLAKKIGVSRNTVINHLSNTGLINQCYRSPNGYLRIPYHIAVEISSPEALAIREIEASRKPINASVRCVDTTPSTVQPLSPHRGRMNGQQSLPERPTKAEGNSRADGSVFRTPTANLAEHYSQIGKALTSAGITLQDLIKYYYQQREQPEADKVSSRSENGGNGGTANRVSGDA